MKIKIIEYCQYAIDGALRILDANKIIDINDDDAIILIEKGLAEQVNETTYPENGQVVSLENKMISLIKKQRGRPRKGV
jgi:hypothetical protein